MNKGPYTLELKDAQGEIIMSLEVAEGMPRTIGWNLNLTWGRDGVIHDIREAIQAHEGLL